MTLTLSEALAEARSGYWGVEPGTSEVDARVVRNGDLSTDCIQWTRCPRRGLTRSEASRSEIRLNDILITTSGECGKVAMIRELPQGKNCASNFVRILRAAPGVEPRFLYWWLTSREAQQLMAPFIRGTTLKNLSFAAFSEAAYLHPLSFSEQQRIADILDKADAIRCKRKEGIARTEELLRSTFLEMVGPGAPDYPRWGTRTIESLAARIPNSLRTGPFGSDLLHSEFVDEGVAVLGIDNAVQNRFAWGERRFITLEKYDRLRRYTVFPGDVIVTIMGTTGRSAVVPEDIPTAITTKHLATITLDRNEAEPEFVSQALFRHPEVLGQISAANRGAIMRGLNLGLIKSLRLPVPPLPRQREFARATARILALAKRMEGERDTEMLFSSLMAGAFSAPFSDGATEC